MAYAFRSGPEARHLLESVRRRGIQRVWHYTLLTALPAIEATGGLLSRLGLEEQGIKYKGHSLGAPEKHQSFGEYTCCGLTRPWGMMRSETEPITVIGLRRRLIWREGTVFIPLGWCSRGDVTYENTKENYTVEVFDSMFDNPTTNWATPHDVEIHVKGFIPVEEVKELYFVDDESSGQAAAQCPGLANELPFIVAPRAFPR